MGQLQHELRQWLSAQEQVDREGFPGFAGPGIGFEVYHL